MTAEPYKYPRMGMRDAAAIMREGWGRLKLDEETRARNKAWYTAMMRYMLPTAPKPARGVHVGAAYEDDRGVVVQPDEKLPRLRVYQSLNKPASGMLPENMHAYDWSRNYVSDPHDAFQIDMRLMARGSIVMSYYDVIQGRQVEGYGSDFQAMTDAITSRIQRETGEDANRFGGRAMLTNLTYLAYLTRDVEPGYEVLFKATLLNMDTVATRDMLLSGELQRLLHGNMPLTYVRSLLGLD